MNNNLIDLKQRNNHEKKAIACKGGKASAKSRKRKKQLKECFSIILEMEVKEDIKEYLSNLGIDKEYHNNLMLMCINLYRNALKGDTKAICTIFDIMGYTNKMSAYQKEMIRIKRERVKLSKEMLEIEKLKINKNITSDKITIVI